MFHVKHSADLSATRGERIIKMKVRIKGKFVDLSPLQTKILVHCILRHSLYECMDCMYDRPCTVHYFIPLGDTPNGAIIPKNFSTRIYTNNYRKLHNLPKKRKGVDYFD